MKPNSKREYREFADNWFSKIMAGSDGVCFCFGNRYFECTYLVIDV